MKTYLVTWEIDIEADSPREAAEKARQAVLRPGTLATVYDVFTDDEGVVRVDLSESEEEAELGTT